MKFITLHRSLLAGSLLVPGYLCRSASPVDAALPAASEVMQRVVKRADDVAQKHEANKYSFEKRSTIEELDASGKPIKTKQKTYEVTPIQGIPFSRLVKIGNRNLTAEEIAIQNRKELEFRKRVDRKDAKPEDDDGPLDPRLVDRFDFKVEGRDCLQGRPVLILSFHPKANRGAEKTVEDKVLNRLAGTLWVDDQEAEVAQLKVGLTEDLSLGLFGMIGSLKQFDLQIERGRLANGAWVTQKQTVKLCGRKIFSTMRYRTLEESSRFRKP
jgi:hypothetical protein